MRPLLTSGLLLPLLAACLRETTVPECKPGSIETVAMRGDTVVTSTGLRYLEVTPGTGPQAFWCERAAVSYTAFLAADGRQVEAHTQIFVPGVGQVIAGFEQGVVGMRSGGQRRLIVPPDLAYGSREVRDPATGQVAVPPNSTLVFDVHLHGAGGGGGI